ncbi:MAG TPA: LL-diaminopimelate aminotransferase [Gaiellaceae bacterium]|nr:LL-diaminopimelate aminotransferase [Gaiellaceae bacterium]
MRFAKRLDAVPPYLFAELERKIEEREQAGIDVISLGIGDPDLPTPEPVVEALARAARDPSTHQYPSNRGTAEFRETVAGFYRERFGVDIDPDREVIPVLGGKEGVAHVALATLDPGDTALAPDPGYPPYTSGPVFSGAHVHYLPLTEDRDFLPDLDSAPDGSLLFLNYPNNPTGATADVDFFERAAAFGRQRGLIVVHDNAYSEITFDGYTAPSFLEAEGAKDVGVEIFSLSKGWNMTGWRAGWIAGNAEVVERYRQLKTNLDSGMFEAVQQAAVAALTDARDFPQQMSAVYRRRRDLVADALRSIGLDVTPPRATPYFWARVPEGHTSASFSELVLDRADVVVSPGNAYGPSGEGYVRLSLTVPDDRLEEAVRRIAGSLPDLSIPADRPVMSDGRAGKARAS